MKGVIGTKDDAVGFGLTGIKQLIELPLSSETEDIHRAIQELHEDTTAVFINETLLKKVRDELSEDTIFIPIPDHAESPNLAEIEKMAKETLGINFE